MNKQYILAGYILSLIAGLITLQAQQTTSSTGGDISGSSGSVSFSVGQVTYQQQSNGNTSVQEGVIQPYELQMTTGFIEDTSINYSSKIFPNPVTDVLTVKITPKRLQKTSYNLYDISGKLLEKKHLTKENTKINFENRKKGIYMLVLVSGDITINTFKVVKL